MRTFGEDDERRGPGLAAGFRIPKANRQDVASDLTQTLQRLIATFFERVVGRFYVLITVASLLLTGLAVWVIATTWNINSDFKALLPRTSAAYQAMQEVGERVGSGSAIFVVIDSPDTEANLRFAEVYAEKMRELDEVALAHFHNDKDFFERHQLLYMEAEDIRTLRERLEEAIREEKRRANPLFVSLRDDDEAREDDGELVETDDLEEKYAGQAQDDYKEYLVADDGYSVTIVVRFVETSTNLLATNRLLDRVEALGESLEPERFHPEMKIELGGGLINRQKEYNNILDDVRSSAIFTLVGLLVVLALYFRRLRAVVIVLGPLIMGIAWTLAVAFLLYGELTTVTVFIFAILLGLGIDFSIHLLSGYDEERLSGKSPVEALTACYNSTGRATVLGALTTFATFVVLSFAQFRGLSQFGTVASIGVLMSLGAMIVVMPAIVLTLHRLRPYAPKPASAIVGGLSPERWVTPAFVARMAPVAATVAVAMTVWSVWDLRLVQFEENFREIGEITWPWEDVEAEESLARVRAAEKAAQGAARAVYVSAREVRKAVEPASFVRDREQTSTGAKYTSAVSGKQSSTPTLLLFDEPEQARVVYEHMRAEKQAGGLDTVRSLASIYAFMPGTIAEQKARLAEMARIERMLEREGTAFLSDEEEARVAELREQLGVDLVTIHDLPEWTKRLFKEAGEAAKPAAEGEAYAFEYLIYVNEAIDQMKGHEARRFLEQVQEVARETGIDVRIGSQSYVYVAMLDEIKNDGARMMAIALVVVFLLLAVGFRSPLRGLVALLPLIVGVIWTIGVAAWLGLRLDFFNVIIIPVIVGIGVDDGVHFYYRYLDRGRGSVPYVLRHVGGAVLMTSVTSGIGFGGLAVTNYDGLQSIGYLAIVGIASTFLSTVLVLPALLYFAEKHGWTWIAAPTEGLGDAEREALNAER